MGDERIVKRVWIMGERENYQLVLNPLPVKCRIEHTLEGKRPPSRALHTSNPLFIPSFLREMVR